MNHIQTYQYKNFNLIFLDSVNSTNTYALELCKNNTKLHQTVVIANEQTNGRGRFNNIWQSKAGKDLTLSLILEPKKPVILWPRLGFMASLCLAKSLTTFLPHNHTISLKWPNDLLINNKKCAGFLAEVSADKKAIVIGLGLNVNSNFEKSSNRCSLKDCLDSTLNIQDILNSWLNELVMQQHYLESCTINTIAWNNYASFMNRLIVLKTSAFETKLGIFKGISQEGYIILKKENGKVEKIANGKQLRLVKNKLNHI